MARPEGLEPPTYRFEDASNAQQHIRTRKASLILLGQMNGSSLPFPTLLGQSGHLLVTKISYSHCLTYSYANFSHAKNP